MSASEGCFPATEKKAARKLPFFVARSAASLGNVSSELEASESFLETRKVITQSIDLGTEALDITAMGDRGVLFTEILGRRLSHTPQALPRPIAHASGHAQRAARKDIAAGQDAMERTIAELKRALPAEGSK